MKIWFNIDDIYSKFYEIILKVFLFGMVNVFGMFCNSLFFVMLVIGFSKIIGLMNFVINKIISLLNRIFK